MASRKSQDKMCAKCRVRKPLRDFFLGVAWDERGLPRVEKSPFCEQCRTTMQTCRRCRQPKSITEYSRRQARDLGICNPCHDAIRDEGYARVRERAAERWRREHGTEMPPEEAGHYAQDPKEVLRAPGRRRRERLKAARGAPVDREAIFERDGWRCGICGEPVDRADAVLDHVVPISLGGRDEPSNVRLAHAMCNSRRGDGEKYMGVPISRDHLRDGWKRVGPNDV